MDNGFTQHHIIAPADIRVHVLVWFIILVRPQLNIFGLFYHSRICS